MGNLLTIPPPPLNKKILLPSLFASTLFKFKMDTFQKNKK